MRKLVIGSTRPDFWLNEDGTETAISAEDLARETYVMETARVWDLMRPTLNRQTARATMAQAGLDPERDGCDCAACASPRDAACYGNGGE